MKSELPKIIIDTPYRVIGLASEKARPACEACGGRGFYILSGRNVIMCRFCARTP